MSHVLAVRIDDQTRQRLDALATATRRSKSFLAKEAIQAFIDLNEWQIRAIQAGIKQADEGELIDHGEMIKRWEARVAAKMDATSRM